MLSPPATTTISPFPLTPKLDRLTICFSDLNAANVNATCGQLITWKTADDLPGVHVQQSPRYRVRALIPLPLHPDLPDTHNAYFEAGPWHQAMPSYRLDFNPSALTEYAITRLLCLLDTCMDATPFEFFSKGTVTRLDAAVDLPGYTLEDVIVRSTGKKKHGAYSNKDGVPETQYIGTPRSARIVCYTKPDPATGQSSLRLERRLRPKIYGLEVADLRNPFAKIELLHVDALASLGLGFPTQFFADSVRLRGLSRALEALPKDQRKAVKTLLTATPNIVPDANQIWCRWKDSLIATGLGHELGALKKMSVAA